MSLEMLLVILGLIFTCLLFYGNRHSRVLKSLSRIFSLFEEYKEASTVDQLEHLNVKLIEFAVCFGRHKDVKPHVLQLFSMIDRKIYLLKLQKLIDAAPKE